MAPPKMIKDIQCFTDRVATLNRYVAKSVERCLPFFKVLKKMKNFLWIEECQKSFDELKRYLSFPPLLTKPKDGERLYLYLSIMSSILVWKEGKIQKLIYYASKALREKEIRYSKLENTMYLLILSTHWLCPYCPAYVCCGTVYPEFSAG